MSNLLKLFNSMSGMQKHFLTEDSKEDIKKLADKIATKTLTGTLGKKRSAGQLNQDLIVRYDADKERFETFKKELDAKVQALQNTVTKLTQQKTALERAFSAAEKRKDVTTVKSLEKKLKRIQTALNDAGRKLRLAESDRIEDLDKAEKKLKRAEDKLAGKTRGEQYVTKKQLDEINPLIVPIKADEEVGPGKLTFAQMSSVAHMGAYGEKNQELIKFDNAITSLNRALFQTFPEFKTRIKGATGKAILADPDVSRLFKLINPDDVSSGSVEKNSDLVKICWLYLGGEEVLSKAKGNENFVSTITTLEAKNKKPVTKPIEEITSVEDMFISEPVKQVFGWYKTYLESLGNGNITNTLITPHVNAIIDAPGSLYSGFSTSTSENIADSIYYIFISVFGSPEDKILLLKNTGTFGKKGTNRLKGSSSYFLAQPALDALALKMKHLLGVVTDLKAFPTQGRKTAWGEKRVNKEYEKGIGDRIRVSMGGTFLSENDPNIRIQNGSSQIMGQVFDITRPFVSSSELLSDLEDAKARLKEVTIPSSKLLTDKAEELAKEDSIENLKALQDEHGPDEKGNPKNSELIFREIKASPEKMRTYASDATDFFEAEKQKIEAKILEIRKDLSEQANQTLVDVRSLFISSEESATALDNIKAAFDNRFKSIKQSKEKELEKLRADFDSKESKAMTGLSAAVQQKKEKILDLEKIIADAEKKMNEFQQGLTSLQPEDIKALSEVFKASVSPEEPKGKKAISKTSVATSSASGKMLVDWIKDLLGALDAYEAQQPGTIGDAGAGPDDAELIYKLSIKEIKANIHKVNRELDRLTRALKTDEESVFLAKELEQFSTTLKEKEQQLKKASSEEGLAAKENLVKIAKLIVGGKVSGEKLETLKEKYKELKELVPDNEEVLKADIEDLKNTINEIEADIKEVSDVITDDFDVAPAKAEYAKLSASLAEVEKELEDYRKTLVDMGVTTTKAGDKRLANIYKLAFNNLLYTGKKKKKKKAEPGTPDTLEVKSDISIPELQQLISKMPTDVFKYVDSKKTRNINELLETLQPEADTQEVEKTNAWEKSVRAALYKFFNYVGSSDIKNDESRSKILSTLAVPFTRELEKVAEYNYLGLTKPSTEKEEPGKEKLIDVTTPSEELDEEKVSKERIKTLRKHIDKLMRAGKPAERAKKELKRLEKKQKQTVATSSIVPGSAFSGNPTIVTEEALSRILLKNAENLQANAKAFYNNILAAVIRLKLADKFANPSETERLLSADDNEFSDFVLRAAEQYKSLLSVNDKAAELEDNLFLKDLVKEGELSLDATSSTGKAIENIEDPLLAGTNVKHSSTYMSREDIKEAFIDSDEFRTFLAAINAAIKNNTVWYEKKVINAPVISENFGLKSATLLNIMSCLKNYDSIEAFDLSANRRNKNVLAILLNINNYPKDFTLYSSTALLMKLYFLLKLKNTVNAVDVIGQFSEKFISPEIKTEVSDKTIDTIIEKLQGLNDSFEKTTLQEFIKDFGKGGTLDQEIEDNLDTLWELAISTGNRIYSMKNATLTPILVTKDTLSSVVLEEGPACLIQFSTEMGKSDAMLSDFLTLFKSNSQELLNKRLQDCISIIKTGLHFYAGYEATKLIAEHQFYDRAAKQKDIQSINEKLQEYFKTAEFASFVGKFATRVNTDPEAETYKSTIKVPTNTKDGFANLNNSFLGVFLKDFTWNALTRTLANLDIEEAESKDVMSPKTIAAEEQVENLNKVFLKGLYKKANAITEKPQIDLNSAEAQKEIEKIIAGNVKKTEKLLKTGAMQNLTPIIVVPEGTKDKKTLKLVLSVKKEGGYTNITKDEGSKIGTRKKKAIIKDSISTKVEQLSSFGQLATTFSTSLEKVAEVLARIYSTEPELVSQIEAYSNSVSGMIDKLIIAILTITENPYNEELQNASLKLLTEIKISEPPERGVNELIDPTATYKKAVESFAGKNNIFYSVYSFAEQAAAAIDNPRKATMSDIIKAVNTVLAGDPNAYKDATLPTSIENTGDTNAPDGIKILTGEDIEKYKSLIFSTILPDEAITNILTAIKKALPEISDPTGETDDVEDSIVSKIEREEGIKTSKEAIIVKVNSIIKTLTDAIAAEQAENKPTVTTKKTAPAAFPAVPKGTLTPEEVAAQAERAAQGYSGVAPEALPTSPLQFEVPKPEEKEKKEDEPLTWSWKKQKPVSEAVEATSPLQDKLTQAKQDLSKHRDAIEKIDIELERLNTLLTNYKEQKAVVGMTKVLVDLYHIAENAFNNVENKVGKENVSAVRKNVYKLEFTPIKDAIPVIMAFIKAEKKRNNLQILDDLYEKFAKFYEERVKTFTDAKKVVKESNESIASFAVRKFITLLEEAETEPELPAEPTDSDMEEEDTRPPAVTLEPLEKSEYILGMARFLSEHQYKTVEDWVAINPIDPSQRRPGVEGSIQDACMIRFLGNTTGISNEAFKNYRYCLNNKVMIGFTVNTGTTKTVEEKQIPVREFVPVQFTRLNIIGKVAAGDDKTIESILHPEEEED